jgi:RNA polymerase sigma factor (sigma-70 family)
MAERREDSLKKTQDPAEIVAAFLHHKEDLLKKIYQENFHPVLHFVLNNNGTEDDARDIYQEAFVAVWNNIRKGQYQPREGISIAAYLHRIAQNKWLDKLRSVQFKRTERLAEETIELAEEDSNTEQEDRIRQVREQFVQLGEQCRDLLTGFYYQKASLRSLAEQRGWTEATARNNKYRCMEKLKALLTKKPIS